MSGRHIRLMRRCNSASLKGEPVSTGNKALAFLARIAARCLGGFFALSCEWIHIQPTGHSAHKTTLRPGSCRNTGHSEVEGAGQTGQKSASGKLGTINGAYRHQLQSRRPLGSWNSDSDGGRTDWACVGWKISRFNAVAPLVLFQVITEL